MEDNVAVLISGAVAVITTVITAGSGVWINKQNKEAARLVREKEDLRLKNDELVEKIEKTQSLLTLAKNSMRAERDAMRFERDWAMSLKMQRKIKKLCAETEIDRVILFVAWNGVHAPQWTKGVWQYRYGEQVEQEFINTDLDDDYRSRLGMMWGSNDGVIFRVSDIPLGTLIRNIYEMEGVFSSLWTHLRKVEYPEGSSYSYFSFATHLDQQITPSTQLRIRLLLDELRGYSMEEERNKHVQT